LLPAAAHDADNAANPHHDIHHLLAERIRDKFSARKSRVLVDAPAALA
jgi:hypothetical protein